MTGLQRTREHRGKIVTADDAVREISDGSVVAVSGSGGGVNEPAEILAALERRFGVDHHPAHLTLYHPNGLGDGNGGGTERFAHPGLVSTVYGSHWSWAPRLGRAALQGKFDRAIWPQGVLSQLLRESAAGRPGLVTIVGLGTYLDPRTTHAREPRTILPVGVTLLGHDYLFYPAPSIDVAIIRATTADTQGNLTFEQEGVVLDALAAAMAAHRNGGLVIAQVKRIAKAGTLDPLWVRVPHYLVDRIVETPRQQQSAGTHYNPAFSGELRINVPAREQERFERLVIARRAALDLQSGDVVNLGFGIADGVAAVCEAEPFRREVVFTIEQGTSGGTPAWGQDFGLMWNPEAILDAPSQFDFYDGGGLDVAVVSFAEVDAKGNVNVSRFGDRLIGPGGFMNITGAAKRIIFCGTFTAQGLQVGWSSGRLDIVQEGAVLKFVDHVQEITFNGQVALAHGQDVTYVTERAVFRLTPDGLELVEVAPGVTVEAVLNGMAFRPKVSAHVNTMDTVVFSPESRGNGGM